MQRPFLGQERSIEHTMVNFYSYHFSWNLLDFEIYVMINLVRNFSHEVSSESFLTVLYILAVDYVGTETLLAVKQNLNYNGFVC